MNDIKIILENGIVIPCHSFGFKKDVVGDFIFNTSLVGYQEVLTDPSYYNEVVVMTFPVQGIYGINNFDSESKHSSPSAFIVQEFETDYSNNHATKSLEEYLLEREILGVAGVDTRFLTRVIRENGSLKGAIVDIDEDEEKVISNLKNKELKGHVPSVSPKVEEIFNPDGEKHVVFMDMGAKSSIIKNLINRGYKVTTVPYDYTYERIKLLNPDYVFISNGPGDPSELVDVVEEVKKMIDDNVKLSGICLGHQLISIALGGKVFRMKFGHHSINHPVKNLEDGKVYLTSQNHNYAVEEETLPIDVKVFLKSLHDGTVAGIKHIKKPIISVQFHPEAAPGPSDANILFDKYFEFMNGDKNA